MLIPVFNPPTDDLEKSYLADNYSTSAITIMVKNSDRFAINDRILIGEQGQEKSEVVTVTAVDVDGTDMTITPTKYSHSSDDPVYKLRFDQVNFFRSTTTNTGPWSSLPTQPLDVDNEDLETKYDDTTGQAGYYYYFTFSHSISLVESADSDVISGAGWRRDQVGNILDEIQREVADPNGNTMGREELLGYFNDVNDELTIDNTKPPSFLKMRMALSRTANTKHLDYPVDAYGRQIMWKFDYMDYEYTDPTTAPATDETKTIELINEQELRNRYSNNTITVSNTSDAKPAAMALDDSVNRFRFSQAFKTTAANVFYLHYWKFFDDISSEGDIIETPTPKIYKLYCKGMFYRRKATSDSSYLAIADRWMADYTVEKNKYRGHNRKDKGTPRGFRPKTRTFRRFRR